MLFVVAGFRGSAKLVPFFVMHFAPLFFNRLARLIRQGKQGSLPARYSRPNTRVSGIIRGCVTAPGTHPRQVATPAPAPGTRVFGDSSSGVEIDQNDVKEKENFALK